MGLRRLQGVVGGWAGAAGLPRGDGGDAGGIRRPRLCGLRRRTQTVFLDRQRQRARRPPARRFRRQGPRRRRRLLSRGARGRRRGQRRAGAAAALSPELLRRLRARSRRPQRRGGVPRAGLTRDAAAQGTGAAGGGWVPMRRKADGQADIDRVWEIIEKVGIAMLTTRFPGGLRARPVEARPERDAGLIWFVTDLESGKEHEVEAEHDVGLVFVDAADKAY